MIYPPFARLARRVVLSLVLLSFAGGAVLAQDVSPASAPDRQARVVPSGSQPFTESWGEIERRDRRISAAAATSRGVLRLRVMPYPEGDEEGGEGRRAPESRPLERRRAFAPAAPISTPQTLGASFAAISLQDQSNDFASGSVPPDTMGAVGSAHFLEIINSSVAIFDKTNGTRLSHVSLESFFSLPPYPRNGAFDPRVLYDRRSGRFFATAMEFGEPAFTANGVILAVSRTSDPTGVWDKYFLDVGDPSVGPASFFSDYSTLGTDENGVYLGTRIFPSAGGGYAKIIATPRAPLLASQPTLGTVYEFTGIVEMFSTPQPALNFDAVAPDYPHFFVGSARTTTENVHYRSLQWTAAGPVLSPPLVATTPPYGIVIEAPAAGEARGIDAGDDRLQMAIIRNNRLWTTRTVGVNASGGDTDADRTGCEWLELAITDATLALEQSGRVFDSAAANPRFYYYPSVVVSGQGHAALGFSGSSALEFVGAYFAGRLAADETGVTGTVGVLKAGAAAYRFIDASDRNRWGDYSYTSLDPNDDMSIWTIQEFAASEAPLPASGVGSWGTWIGKLLAPPPATPSVADPASTTTGQSSVTVLITGDAAGGAGFYDPGTGFAARLTATLGSGIIVNSVTYNNPTQLTLDLDTTAALPGAADITVKNPDAQARTSTGILTVTVPTPTPSPTATPTATPTSTPQPTASPTPTPQPTATPTPTPAPTATPTSIASPTPTATPTPTPSPSPSPTPVASATPTPAPSASPTPAAERFRNISTRARVRPDDRPLIGGFIVTGNAPTRVLLRAIGPSLGSAGAPIPGRLTNPALTLYDSEGRLIAVNDDWRETQQDEIEATGAAPNDDRESAIVRTLDPGSYTAVLTGRDGTSGIALSETFDLTNAASSQVANLSTRGFVDTGDNVLIGGFIIGAGERGEADVVLRAIGPSLRGLGIDDPLADPAMELRDGDGALLATNNDWQDSQRAEIGESGIAPSDERESAIRRSMTPGSYTVVVSGTDPAMTGTALVELYNLSQ